MKMLVYGAGAAWSRLFCLDLEPTLFVRSRLRDLGLPEPEPKSGGSATLMQMMTFHVIFLWQNDVNVHMI